MHLFFPPVPLPVPSSFTSSWSSPRPLYSFSSYPIISVPDHLTSLIPLSFSLLFYVILLLRLLFHLVLLILPPPTPPSPKPLGSFLLHLLIALLAHLFPFHYSFSYFSTCFYASFQPERKYFTITQRDEILLYFRLKKHNFRKYNVSRIDSLGIPYDYLSVMHYSSNAYGFNGLTTIIAKYPSVEQLGQRIGHSPLDVRQADSPHDCKGRWL